MVKNKRILITGGLGFIGFNAVKYFSVNNDICIVDDCSRIGVDSNIQELNGLGVKHFHVDIANFLKLSEVFFAYQPDIVIHLAAQVAVTLSVENPLKDFQSNIVGSFNILELARLSKKTPILLYSSTNKVFGGNVQTNEIRNGRYVAPDYEYGYGEDVQLSFETPYGCSKGAADQYFLDYAKTYGIPTVVFRQSCIYGTHQFGMEDQGWVAWFAICSVFKKDLTIFGDGKQVRDVLYVDDLLALYETSIEQIDAVKGEVFNIGGGPRNTLSLLELIHLLDKQSEQPLNVGFADWRPNDQKVFIADIRKAKHLLGWEPRIGPEEGVQKMINWIKKEKSYIQEVMAKQEKQRQHIDVTIVIPAKNEEESLPLVLEQVELLLESSSYVYEVIVVDDRSTDRTVEIASQFPFVKIVKNNKYPSGKGVALRAGFDKAKGVYILMMDADNSHNAADIPLLVDAVKKDNGLIIASRISGGSEEYTLVRAVGNVGLTMIFGLIHKRYLSDVLNGFKIFHRDIYFSVEYTSPQFEIEIELVVNALRMGRTVGEIPSHERARYGGKMKSSVLKHGPRFLWRIIFEYFRSPRRIDK